jgi:hypothetical protein
MQELSTENLMSGQQGVRLTRSLVNRSPVNKFRREVPVNWSIPLTGTECTILKYHMKSVSDCFLIAIGLITIQVMIILAE